MDSRHRADRGIPGDNRTSPLFTLAEGSRHTVNPSLPDMGWVLLIDLGRRPVTHSRSPAAKARLPAELRAEDPRCGTRGRIPCPTQHEEQPFLLES